MHGAIGGRLGIKASGGQTYAWEGDSTYVQNPPYFVDMSMTPKPVVDIQGAAILGISLPVILPVILAIAQPEVFPSVSRSTMISSIWHLPHSLPQPVGCGGAQRHKGAQNLIQFFQPRPRLGLAQMAVGQTQHIASRRLPAFAHEVRQKGGEVGVARHVSCGHLRQRDAQDTTSSMRTSMSTPIASASATHAPDETPVALRSTRDSTLCSRFVTPSRYGIVQPPPSYDTVTTGRLAVGRMKAHTL
jgi:hypothetical protein